MDSSGEKWREMDMLFFLRDNDVWVGLEHTTEILDQYAALFMQQIKKNDEESAKEVLIALTKDAVQPEKEVYKLIMNKMLEKGADWHTNEAWRIRKILDDTDKVKSINKDKLENMKARLNVLFSFGKPVNIQMLKDEL